VPAEDEPVGAAPITPQLYLERDMEDVETFAVAAGLAVVHSARCPGKDGTNEDGALVIPLAEDSAVLAVADGVGGARGGARAAALALGCLSDAVLRRSDETLRTAILDAFEVANEAVLGLATGAATTLSVVELAGGAMRPYHVGDSSILVFGQRGRVKLQTVAHSPVGFGVEAGLLDAEAAIHHEERHVVSNVLGSSSMRIEVGSELALSRHDRLVLASDGLLDNLHADEVVEHLRAGGLAGAARALVTETQRRMREPRDGEPSKPDDLTFVAYGRAGARRR